MAIGYYKTFKSDDVSHDKFVAHKQWTLSGPSDLVASIQVSGSRVTGSQHYIAHYSSASKNDFISGSSVEPSTNNKYKFVMHSSIDQMFYRFNSKGADNSQGAVPLQFYDPIRQQRDLHEAAHILTIPKAYIGEAIKPFSVNIYDADSGTRLEDDGYANLVDRTIATESMVLNDKLSVHIPFSDGYKYQNSGNKPVFIGDYYKQYKGMHYNGAYPFLINAHNVKFEKGMHGYALNTLGVSGSYVIADRKGDIQSELGIDQEFAIAMWLKIPTSQSVSHSRVGSWGAEKFRQISPQWQYNVYRRNLALHTDNTIVTKRANPSEINPFPFEISVGNSHGSNKGKLIFKRSAGTTTKELISSDAYNDNTWRHYVFQKTGSNLEMYCDGLLVGTTPDFTSQNYGTTINSNPLTIGGNRMVSAWKHLSERADNQGSGGSILAQPAPPFPIPGNTAQYEAYQPTRFTSDGIVKFNTDVETFVKPFTGSMDELRIYNQAIPSASIAALSQSVSNTNIVGNIFYDYGLAVITDPRPKYQDNLFNEEDEWYINFKNTFTIWESEYYCHIKSSEYDVSMNPTLRKNNSVTDARLKGFASSSDFAPYFTTIGLYNDNYELMAVAKTPSPVKKPKNMDTTIVVRFDK